MQYNGTWGTVCDDDWDMVDANVVCRQLECGLAVAVGTSSRFGQGSGPILLDNVDCKGGEMDLSLCGNQGWGIHNCYHYEDVAVTCKGKAKSVELLLFYISNRKNNKKYCLSSEILSILLTKDLQCILFVGHMM